MQRNVVVFEAESMLSNGCIPNPSNSGLRNVQSSFSQTFFVDKYDCVWFLVHYSFFWRSEAWDDHHDDAFVAWIWFSTFLFWFSSVWKFPRPQFVFGSQGLIIRFVNLPFGFFQIWPSYPSSPYVKKPGIISQQYLLPFFRALHIVIVFLNSDVMYEITKKFKKTPKYLLPLTFWPRACTLSNFCCTSCYLKFCHDQKSLDTMLFWSNNNHPISETF